MSKFLQYFQKTDATAAKLDELEAKIANLTADADTQDAALAEALEKNASLAEELARVQTEHAAALENLKAEHATALETLKAEHAANVQTEAARVAASQGAELPLPTGNTDLSQTPGRTSAELWATYNELKKAGEHAAASALYQENRELMRG